jgi:anti-sigma factor RsiW
MTGDPWTARLSDYVDDELAPAEREALERHLAECTACEATVAGLRRVKLRAGALAERGPQHDLWPAIAGRIGLASGELEVVTPRRVPARRWAFTLSLPQLAAAAVLLLAVGAGATWLSLGTSQRPAAAVARPSIGPAPVTAERFAGSGAYQAAIADFQRVLDAHRSQLDTATVRVIEESLRTIDRAIARAEAALAADPSDAYLNAHLAETMRQKLELMRRAALVASRAS